MINYKCLYIVFAIKGILHHRDNLLVSPLLVSMEMTPSHGLSVGMSVHMNLNPWITHDNEKLE